MPGLNKQESMEMVEFTPRAPQKTEETLDVGGATVVNIELEDDGERGELSIVETKNSSSPAGTAADEGERVIVETKNSSSLSGTGADEGSSSAYVVVEVDGEESDNESSALLLTAAAAANEPSVVIEMESSSLVVNGEQDEETLNGPEAEGVVKVAEDELICRICLSSDSGHGPFIRPCKCKNNGVAIAEHELCVIRWIKEMDQPRYHCMTCKSPYKYTETRARFDYLACWQHNAKEPMFNLCIFIAHLVLILGLAVPDIPFFVVILVLGMILDFMGYLMYRSCNGGRFVIPSTLTIHDFEEGNAMR